MMIASDVGNSGGHSSCTSARGRFLGAFGQDRFQFAVVLILFVYKARISLSEQAAFPVLSLSMDLLAVYGMYMMHKANVPLSGLSLINCAVVNSIKFFCLEQDILYLSVASSAMLMLWIHHQSIVIMIIASLPALLTYTGHLPSPFAAAYLLEAAMGLPLLFLTLPNQFGRRRSVNGPACHVLALLLLGRAFQARHYLNIGLFRLFEGPWDVPAVFSGNDCFAMVARSVGFFLHLLQAGFFVKFALYYIPAFFSCSDFRMQRVGCRLPVSLMTQKKTVTPANE